MRTIPAFFTKTLFAAVIITIVTCVSRDIRADTHYVWLGSLTPAPPYTNWAAAAHDIQSAVDAAGPGDVVLVTNGLYNTGLGIVDGHTNRVAATQAITIRSVNGPESTAIVGSNMVRGVYLSGARGVYLSGAAELCGFTVSNGIFNESATEPMYCGGGLLCVSGGVARGCTIVDNLAWTGGGNVCLFRGGSVEGCWIGRGYTLNRGGGVYCYEGGAVFECVIEDNFGNVGGGAYCDGGGLILNSVLRSNWTYNYGGGVYASGGVTVRNCLIARNSAEREGGGMFFWGNAILENSTVCSNTAVTGGGVACFGGTSVNSIVYYNWPDNCSNTAWTGVFVHCCTYPEVAGEGNITNDPRFFDWEGGDFHLFPESPCRNSGTNQAWMTGTHDLEGAPRIAEQIVDIGALEIAGLMCRFTGQPIFGYAPLTVHFAGLVSGTNTANVYFFWDFDDNGAIDSSGLGDDTPQFVYSNEGIYSVNLSVSNAPSETAAYLMPSYIEVVPEPHALAIGLCLLVGAHRFWMRRLCRRTAN